MKLSRLLLAFIATICLIFAGNALAQIDININNTNLIRFGGNVTVPGNQVVENAHAFGGNVTVLPNARVVNTAIAVGGDVILKAGARVDGDAYAVGGKIVQEPGASIGGERTTFNDAPAERLRQRHGMMSGTYGRYGFFPWYFFHAMFRISAAVVAVLLGLIIIQTRPQFLPNLAAKLSQSPGLSALWGIGAIVLIIFVSVLLAITLIGIPLIPLISLCTSVASLVGALGVALFVGQSLDRHGKLSILQQFLMGWASLTVLGLIPFLGSLVVFLVNLLGLGALLLWQFGRQKHQIVS